MCQEAAEALSRIQANMLEKARDVLERSRVQVTDWAQFLAALRNRCFAEAPFCGTDACEESVKLRSKTEEREGEGEASELSGSAKSLCVPFAQKVLSEHQKCFACAENAANWTLFGRSY